MAENVLNEAKIKQPKLFHQFMHVIDRNELSHAYLFTGEDGAGQEAVAIGIAMRLFCTNLQDGYPCGKCPECTRIMNHDHPDVVMTKPDGLSIKVDQIRHVKSEFTKSAMEGAKKVFIISDAEKMTTSAANSLLKFIEEPTGNVVSFLLSQNRHLILPTIVSRTQVVEFPSVGKDIMAKELRESGILPSQVNLLMSLTNSLSEVQSWQADNWFTSLQQAISKWFDYLVKGNPMAMPAIQMTLMPLITGKERQRVALSIMISIFDEVLEIKYHTLKKTAVKFPEIAADTQQAAQKWSSTQLMAMLGDLLETHRSMAVNVNFQNIIESVTLKMLAIVKPANFKG
ncbi:DNA polymerase III subunit delta' [Lentilactobacillus raoultii]|uniref:DNA polymerase III subunit delta n=1 Tax=Lentilactobacillus raoultii TaxID=1987503 RepID=A0ABW3PEI5_9LACO|nr:DNA polymerase III subunit delta' [Lentilactobacillus raoultii]